MNFTSHLYRTATKLLREAGLPQTLVEHALLPLTLQSAKNAAAFPESALTGPAARGDEEIISAHMDALARTNNSDIAKLYNLVTKHIIDNKIVDSQSEQDHEKKQT